MKSSFFLERGRKMEKVMCKQKIVLETIKKMKGRGKMSAVQVQLAEAQCEDYQTMKKEILEIKSDVSSLKKDNEYIKGQLDIVVKSLQPKQKETFSQKMTALKDTPVLFWVMLIVLICTIGAICGANMEWIRGAFHITGGQ